jgi:UPF0271 protein
MLATAAKAAALGVTVGAHPSYPDRAGFGRRELDLPASEIIASVAYQIGALGTVAAAAGTTVGFVKAHGALYNQAAAGTEVGEALVEAVALASTGLARRGRLPLLCQSGSRLVQIAEAAGVPVFHEAFADRAYTDSGALASRSEPGSVITNATIAARRAVMLAERGLVETVAGRTLELRVDSICVHGDTPGAVSVARSVRAALERAGIEVTSFAKT